MCHRWAEFDNELIADAIDAANSGRSPRAAQSVGELRQGIFGRRFNCKSDDGFIVPMCFRNAALQLRRVDTLRAFQQNVRTRERVRRTEAAANPIVGKNSADASLHRFACRCVDAQRSGPFHSECIVRRVSQSFPARVVSVGKNAAWVVLDAEDQPRIADLKRFSTGQKREMLVPGDRVDVRVLEDGRVLVDGMHPRTFTLQRRTVEGRSKIIAANVDTMVTVTALADPPPRLLTLDQLLAFAEFEEISPLVVFTKPDLAGEQAASELTNLYGSLGYQTLVINPKAGMNVQALRTTLEHRHALLSGVSGVGKSSIFRALGGDAVIGDVSRHGRGRQTTTAARLYRLPDGFLIDSPGVAEFGLGAVTSGELVEGFREMRGPAKQCRFSDCSHLREPGCAVVQAVADGGIAASRYASFRRILGVDPVAAL